MGTARCAALSYAIATSFGKIVYYRKSKVLPLCIFFPYIKTLAKGFVLFLMFCAIVLTNKKTCCLKSLFKTLAVATRKVRAEKRKTTSTTYHYADSDSS